MRRVARALALVAVIALSRSADAGGAKEDAQLELTEGNRLFAEGEYLTALERFRAAHARFPSPKLWLNEAATLRLLGRNVEAAACYERYLAAPDRDVTKLVQVQRMLSEIDALTARVTVRVSEPGASVRLDGSPLADARVRLDPGDHAFVAEKPGFVVAIASVRLAPGEDRALELALARPGERVVVKRAAPGATQRALGWVTSGLGLVALSAGLGLVVAQREKTDAASAECAPSTHFAGALVCGPRGVTLLDDAERLRSAAVWTSIAGAVGIAGGLALVVTAPAAPRATARLSLAPLPLGVLATGSF